MGRRKAKGPSDWRHVTIFDRPYPIEKQAEGMAIHQAVATGACDKCGFLRQCSADVSFKPPVFAWCSRKKAELLLKLRRSRGGVLS